MDRVHVLDCTLRDGGYCNGWEFGYGNVKKIIAGLLEAGIDVVECGFLTDRVTYAPDITKFTDVSQLCGILPEKHAGTMFVLMVNYGEYDADKLPPCGESCIDGIRVAFHKEELVGAFALCGRIKAKGYKVFLQPMVSLNYTDAEFLSLVGYANQLAPYAFYIVDSFGVMKGKELARLFYMVEHNLAKGICVGFHSHNNMQLSYSNAQALVAMQTDRELLIDSSVYGMGRGAGNLNTELFVDYLNGTMGTSYRLAPLLGIIDEVLNRFYQENYWGYSLPNYISAVHNAHPNYAGFLDQRKTLTIEGMDGYSPDPEGNYARHWMNVYAQRAVMEALNQGMSEVLCEFSREVGIEFITGMRYVKVGE